MTGGISLLNKNNLFGEITREKGFFEFEGTNPISKSNQNEEEINNWLSEMRNYFYKVKDCQKKISAEYSMIHALNENKKLSEKPEIILIHTNTFGGKAAAYLNKEIIEREFGAKVKLEEIKELDVSDRIKLNHSLGDFMSLINKHLSDGHKSYTCFAPIGGYKIFSYLGYVVGAFNDLPTAYLHEDKQVLHEIPPVPIRYDETFVEKNGDFLREVYIKGIVKLEDLDYNQRTLVEENSHFFETSDGLVSINIFAEKFVCEQAYFRYIFGSKVLISDEVKRLIIKNPSAKEFIYQQIVTLVNKIENESDDNDLYHERQFSSLKDKKIKYRLYKGASNGTYVFRCAWKYDEEKRELYINFIWLDHPKYEREAAEGKGIIEDFGNFEEISKELYTASFQEI